MNNFKINFDYGKHDINNIFIDFLNKELMNYIKENLLISDER